MLRVKDEEGFMSKGRDYQDGTLSEDYSENELELYQQYCAGKYGEHSTVPASPHSHSTLQSNIKYLFTKLAHLDILVKLLETYFQQCKNSSYVLEWETIKIYCLQNVSNYQ